MIDYLAGKSSILCQQCGEKVLLKNLPVCNNCHFDMSELIVPEIGVFIDYLRSNGFLYTKVVDSGNVLIGADTDIGLNKQANIICIDNHVLGELKEDVGSSSVSIRSWTKNRADKKYIYYWQTIFEIFGDYTINIERLEP